MKKADGGKGRWCENLVGLKVFHNTVNMLKSGHGIFFALSFQRC